MTWSINDNGEFVFTIPRLDGDGEFGGEFVGKLSIIPGDTIEPIGDTIRDGMSSKDSADCRGVDSWIEFTELLACDDRSFIDLSGELFCFWGLCLRTVRIVRLVLAGDDIMEVIGTRPLVPDSRTLYKGVRRLSL